MKKIRYLALAVCMLYVCFFTGCMFIDSTPAYEDRAYRKVEQAELDAALEELRSISQAGKTAEDFIRAYRKAESLSKALTTQASMLEVDLKRDPNNEEKAIEADEVYSMISWFFYEFKNCELELAASSAEALMLEAFGENYLNRLHMFYYIDDEQYALKAEESGLMNQYYSLSEDDVQGMIDLYVELIRVRNERAKNYGFDSFTEYYYISNYERDYTPDQAVQLFEYAKKWLAPLYDDTMGYDASPLENLFSEEEFMSLLDKAVELSGERSLQNTLRHIKEKNLYQYSVSSSNDLNISLHEMPTYGDSFFNVQATGSFNDFASMMWGYGSYAISYLGDDSQHAFGFVHDLIDTAAMGMDTLMIPLYSQLFSEEYAAAAKADQANYYTWAILRYLAYDAFERFAYSLDEETLNSPDIGDILNEEYKRLLTELNLYSENNNFYTTYQFYITPLSAITFSISRLMSMQFAQPTINGVPAAEVYARFAKCGEHDLYMSVINRVGLSSPFEEATVKSAAETIIRLIQESGRSVDLSDWPAA